jgi:hypothetical protein
MRAPRFQPYALLCSLPWVLALYEHRYGTYHVGSEHLYKLKVAFLWAMLVAVAGLFLASISAWRTRSVTAGVFALCAAGFLAWFPWDVFRRIIQL